MSNDIAKQVQLLRSKADFLVEHRRFLLEHNYDAAVDAARQRRDELVAEAETAGADSVAVDAIPNVSELAEDIGYLQVDVSWGSVMEFRVSGQPKAVKRTIRQLRRELGGKWNKEVSTYQYSLERWEEVAPGVTLRFTISAARDAVCRPVVVGTEEKVIPAVEARPERVEVVEKIEYVCPKLLEGDQDEVPAAA